MTGSANAFNQILEKNHDELMERTAQRPLPLGKLSSFQAIIFATFIGVFGLFVLYHVSPGGYKSCLFALLSTLLYVLVYTPLKRISPIAIFVGAFPGAIPVLLGWVAATNDFGLAAGILFAVQFCWQFPHFVAISWVLDEEYKKAGFNMLPMNTKDKGAVKQIIFYTVVMILVSIIPVFKVSGAFYIYPLTAVIVALLGVVMLYYGVKLHKTEQNTDARKLMLSSVLYITVLQIVYVVDKFLH